jgi:hypothetical protein
LLNIGGEFAEPNGHGAEPSRRNTETPQTVGSGGVVRRLGMRFFLFHSFWDFGYREVERQKCLSFKISGSGKL